MQRIFELKDNVLYMRTYLEDDFGEVCLMTASGLAPSGSIILQQVEGSDSSIPMGTRIHEMYHFLSVLKLFDPFFNSRTTHVSEIVSPPASPGSEI